MSIAHMKTYNVNKAQRYSKRLMPTTSLFSPRNANITSTQTLDFKSTTKIVDKTADTQKSKEDLTKDSPHNIPPPYDPVK